MKGVLRKEYYMLQRQWKSWLAVYLFLFLYGFLVKNWGMMTFCPVLLGINMSLAMFTYDNMSHWDNFVLTLPVTRKTIVSARYITVFVLTFMGFMLGGILAVLTGWVNGDFDVSAFWGSMYGSAAFTLFAQLCLIPVVYHLGPEKGRYAYMILCVLPGALLFFAMFTGTLYPILAVMKRLLWLFAIVIPVFLILLGLVSWRWSVRIYEEKEF